MSKFSRNSPTIKPELVSIDRPFSNFDFIEEILPPDFPIHIPIQRLFSQVRQHEGKSLIIEQIEKSDDIKEEDEDIKQRNNDFQTSTIHRLSFFKKQIGHLNELSDTEPGDFLGYAVLKFNLFGSSLPIIRIYESVIKHSKHANNYIHGCPCWKCDVNSKSFEIDGYLYAQQNSISNVCAHVALRTAISRFSDQGDMTYREMNKIIGIDKSSNPIDGLDKDDLIKILNSAGANCQEAMKTADVPLRKWIYGGVESGFPAIVIFPVATSNDHHAIPIIGHTFNEDTWVPRAEMPSPLEGYFKVSDKIQYTPSEAFTDMFIIHDDNYGSNYCVPKDYFEGIKGASVLVPKPPNVLMDSIEAESIGSGYLIDFFPLIQDAGPWAKRLNFYHFIKLLVIRPVLIDGKRYVEHLRMIRGWDDKERITNEIFLGDFESQFGDEALWMVELSIPELFSANKRKLGEVILFADSPTTEQDYSSLCMARLPGYFIIYEGGGQAKPKFKVDKSGINCHVCLYGTSEH